MAVIDRRLAGINRFGQLSSGVVEVDVLGLHVVLQPAGAELAPDARLLETAPRCLYRVFFTGAFRRPREANWVIGSLLLILAMFEGYFGYSLPDDLLSGIGLRAALSSITLGLPVVGTWMHWALFGGDFPGHVLLPRLYALHVLIIPGIILALIGIHLALVWFQKHTQFPAPAAPR
jgi:hypothetical protein